MREVSNSIEMKGPPYWILVCRVVTMIISSNCDVEKGAKTERLVATQGHGKASPFRSTQIVVFHTGCIS